MFEEINIHPFEMKTGSQRIAKPWIIIALLLLATAAALITVKFEIIGVGICLGLIGALIYGYFIFKNPAIGLYTAVMLSFILIGAGRYIKDVQMGLGMDAIIILTYVALFFNQFRNRVDFSPAKKDITLLAFIWLLYAVFEIFNPEASSLAAWFSGRGISIYMFLIIPLALLFIDNTRKLYTFFYIWAVLSLLASLKGIMQVKYGVDAGEQAWLNEGNYKTHILFGKLRAFSFLSDAGQFGANQGYSAVMALIVGIASKSWKKKTFFFTVALLALYGLMISGTRGALSVPLAGLGLFFILRKNTAVLAVGAVLFITIIYFFMFTTIGQDNSDIRRMRTAFDPNDASLQVRLANQKILKEYLSTRPFGGGIGHGGVKAQRFLPNAYLSQIPTDSWYVLIWAEQGIVGLLLHILILLYILFKSCYKIMFRIRDPQLQLLMSALASGMFGVMIASYGNAVLGQMPTNILIYISMAVLLNTDKLDITPETVIIKQKNN